MQKQIKPQPGAQVQGRQQEALDGRGSESLHLRGNYQNLNFSTKESESKDGDARSNGKKENRGADD